MNNIELIKKYVSLDCQKQAFKELEEGRPIQYIIGNVDFCGNIINVDERVLIPRFETENLVDLTIKYAKEKFKNKINILDLGTGSGCVAISLKKELDADVTATDISFEALEVAKSNALLNNVDIMFLEYDMKDEIDGKYDIIISNPPYVAENAYIENIVKDNEPHIALFATEDGLYYYKKILNYAFKILNRRGFIAFEIGDGEKESLENILKDMGINNYIFLKDLANNYRHLFIFNE